MIYSAGGVAAGVGRPAGEVGAAGLSARPGRMLAGAPEWTGIGVTVPVDGRGSYPGVLRPGLLGTAGAIEPDPVLPVAAPTGVAGVLAVLAGLADPVADEGVKPGRDGLVRVVPVLGPVV